MEQMLSIGEVAERSGMATSALRFYDEQGLISSERTGGGHRLYHRAVLRRLAFIRVAQRVGLSLTDISSALSELPAGRTPTKDDWERLSRKWRGHLDERITLLERLRDQLTSCIGCGCLSLRTCALSNPADAASALGTGPRYLLGDSSNDVAPRGSRAGR